MADVKIASCYMNVQGAEILTFVGDAAGQCFSFLGNAYKLKSCKFNLMKHGTPTGFVGARLYACTGVCGSTGMPTGSALAQSTNTLDVAQFSDLRYAWKIFYFDGAFEMQPDTYYVIVVYVVSGSYDGSNYVMVSEDYQTNPCGGNISWWTGSVWESYADFDIEFEVWGEEIIPPSAGGILAQIM